jgi:FMN phosphatase YigB (HAD superfamily)
MVEWATIQVIEGIADVLRYLHASGRRMILATSAQISDEDEIRGALARAGLDSYFSKIYCFQNTQLSKSKAFYHHILSDLGISAAEAMMVGDSFEKDVQDANMAGLFAVWFNPISDEICKDELHTTVTSMQELGTFFRSLDQK